jgi:predicted nucleic acid-binding protein
MLLGADTGFLVRQAAGSRRAVQLWSELVEGQHSLVLSTLSVAEYLAHCIQRGKLPAGEVLIDHLAREPNVAIIPVSLGLASHSARYRVGLKIPTVDSLILTTFLEAGCDLVLTTDPHLEKAQRQGLIDVELLE